MHNKIIPCLWLNNEADDATKFYTSIFKNSKIGRVTYFNGVGEEISGKKAGEVMAIDFEIEGKEFQVLNGGPFFKLNPSTSFFVTYETTEEIDTLWSKLSADGTVLMELDKYPWSEHYGWIQDQFGVSWQISQGTKKDVKHTISTAIMFIGENFKKAEEAVNFYHSIFNPSQIDGILKQTEGEEKGAVLHAQFSLCNETFMIMENSQKHDFKLSEATSHAIMCKDQAEIDYYWEKLSEGGDENAQQCGWLKDKFGVSWQIVPAILPDLMKDNTSPEAKKLTEALFKMKKLDIEALKKAMK